MQQFRKWNNCYKYLLIIIDIFSKFVWIVLFKNKKSDVVAKAFNQIFKENRVPKYLWTDQRKEFYNKNWKELLDKRNVKLYSTENKEKTSVVERWNGTTKTKMWKLFTEQNSTQYLKMLPDIINKYNNSYHLSIKMSPVEASKKKKKVLFIIICIVTLKQQKQNQNLKLEIQLEFLNTNEKHLIRGILQIWQKKYLLFPKF